MKLLVNNPDLPQNILKIMILKLLLFFLSLFFGFSCQKKVESTQVKPTVLVSIPPYSYFVNKIAKDAVLVDTLIPPGANPHLYEVTPKEAQTHQNAALWVYLGESLDTQVLKFFKNTGKQIQVLDITEGLDLVASPCHHHHQEKDLHLWLSPTLAKAQVKKIAEALILLLPEKKEEFYANAHALLEELDQLDAEIQTLLKPLEGTTILVSHPAFAYFCRDYHLIQLSIEMEGKDPLPQHISYVLKRAEEERVKKILTQPQYSNKGAEVIASHLHCATHLIDPYSENYTENLLHIAQVIAQ